jgi:hypothetical protein
MRPIEMTILCEQLCEEVRPHIGNDSVRITQRVMSTLHNFVIDCDKETYIWIFMRAAALGVQVDNAQDQLMESSDQTWIEFISERIRTH